MADAAINIIVPGIFGLGLSLDMVLSGRERHDARALTRFIAGGRVKKLAPLKTEHAVCDALGVPHVLADVGEASLACIAARGTLPKKSALLLEPVHLGVGRRGLNLQPLGDSVLDDDEVRAMADVCAPVCAPYGFDVQILQPFGQIVLCADRYLSVEIPDLWQVLASGINHERLQGADAAEITKLRNELDMVFHDSALNQRRNDLGLAPINGVWLWGLGGDDANVPRQVTSAKRVVSKNPTIAGLAKLAGAEAIIDNQPSHLLANDVWVLEGARALAAFNNIEAWIKCVSELNHILESRLFLDRSSVVERLIASNLSARSVILFDPEGVELRYPSIRRRLSRFVNQRQDGLYSELRHVRNAVT